MGKRDVLFDPEFLPELGFPPRWTMMLARGATVALRITTIESRMPKDDGLAVAIWQLRPWRT